MTSQTVLECTQYLSCKKTQEDVTQLVLMKLGSLFYNSHNNKTRAKREIKQKSNEKHKRC